MSNLESIVDHDAHPFKGQFEDQNAWKDQPPRGREIRKRLFAELCRILEFLDARDDRLSFHEVERKLVPMVFVLGRLLLAYFLTRRQETSRRRLRQRAPQGYRSGRSQSRLLGTFFGKVRYWRCYLRESGGSAGTYPLDIELGLTADGFSMFVLALAARLATLVSFDQAGGLLLTFLSWSPAKRTIENTVLGFGRYTGEWFECAAPPEGDGEILVIQIDSKATPTATDGELKKRRGKRDRRPRAPSPRHRGRQERQRRGSKPRRKKGDKSKNGKATTVVVMYTLKSGRDAKGRSVLLGPINRWLYASYAPKRHAFAVARREADKRGFSTESEKIIQIVTDGDEDLERYRREFFPDAIHTLDIMHALEYVFKAGSCLYREGSRELERWFDRKKALLYDGKAKKLLADLKRHRRRDIPRTGPGTKSKRDKLTKVIGYLEKRLDMMEYDLLRAEDLEIASGSVEGAVKHLVAKRFDNGSMRWIKERAEALLQLRAIEINGHWDEFIAFVHTRVLDAQEAKMALTRLLTDKPAHLPNLGVAA